MTGDSRLSDARHRIPVLITHSKASKSSQLRQVLIGLGFDRIQLCNSYMKALVEAKQQSDYTVVFFEATTPEGSEISVEQLVEFLRKLLRNPILIAMDDNADGERMFGLLRKGAKGFVVAPFNSESIENAFFQIQSGYQLNDEVLHAEDSNSAFAHLIADKYRTVIEDMKIRKNSSVEAFPDSFDTLHKLIKVARFFTGKNEGKVFDKLHEHFHDKAALIDAELEKSRLRQTRDKLRAARAGGPGGR